MKGICYLIFFCVSLSFVSTAQGIDASIHIFFEEIESDAYPNEVQIVPHIYSTRPESQFLYYLAVYRKDGIAKKDELKRQSGLLALIPGDTSSIYLTFNPIPKDSGNRIIQIFISENEFVLAKATWNWPQGNTAITAEKSNNKIEQIETENKAKEPLVVKNRVKQEKSNEEKKVKTSKKSELEGGGQPSPVDKTTNPPPEQQPTASKPMSKTPEQQTSNFAIPKSTTPEPSKSSSGKPFVSTDDFEISGLMFNETRSRLGAEFYKKLTEIWTPPEKAGSYWITVRELPSPGSSTILSVHLNNRELFQRNLYPKAGYVESLAYQTANLLNSILKEGNYDGSLRNEDLFGSGVE